MSAKMVNVSRKKTQIALGLLLAQLSAPVALAQDAARINVGANTEQADQLTTGALGQAGFSISIDNAYFAGANVPPVADRTNDLIATAVNLDVRFDGLDTERALNVFTLSPRIAYLPGERVSFQALMNYPAYVARTELRILDRSGPGRRTLAVVPIAPNGQASWVMPSAGPDQMAYVLRTYDAAGRFDETQPLPLIRTTRQSQAQGPQTAPFRSAGVVEDRSRLRRIPVYGGTVTVAGQGATPGGTVNVMGEAVPVDRTGQFRVERILPAGDHIVTVDLNGKHYVRDVNIPKSEWFYVGIIDLTAGLRDDGSIGARETYFNGRVGAYAKGKTQGGWTLTGSLDTDDGPIEDIFTRLNSKDPRRVLARVRSDDNAPFPTYGDDSESYDDTPSQGRVYLRAERDNMRFTWGDFKAGVTSGGLLNNQRDLYGAELRYQSRSVTEEGEARLAAQLYAASPETVVQRDILRGTGGSTYFLKHQDITTGSQAVVVQSIDPTTGRIVSTRKLTVGQDYRIDYMQGVIILNQPLASTTSGGGLVSGGAGSYDQNLIVQYEYTPTGGAGGATAFGGRAEGWVTERMRLGATHMQEETAGGTQQISGADMVVAIGKESSLELEYARTSGPGLARATSTDGGLTLLSSGGGSATGRALRFDSHFALRDLGLDRDGHLSLYASRKEAGFSTLTEDITATQEMVGLSGEIKFSEGNSLDGKVESFRTAAGEAKQVAHLNANITLTPDWGLGVGLAYLDQTQPTNPTGTGQRTDAAVRLTYGGYEGTDLYGFVQNTLTLSGSLPRNNRYGAGFDTQLNDHWSATGELSDGDLGTAGSLRVTYAPTAHSNYYLGYEMAANDAATGQAPASANGTVIAGANTRYTAKLTGFAETKMDLPAPRRATTNALGLTYTPNAQWTFGGAYETGIVRDQVSGDFSRDAVSLSAKYAWKETRTGHLKLEYSREDGVGTAQDRETIGLSAGYMTRVKRDWRFMANLDALFSDSAQGTFHDGTYAKLRLGYAYRPIDNERLNLLFGYTYLNDQPGLNQVDANGNQNGPKQLSHVLSLAGNYDLSEKLTFGGKLGVRRSLVATRGTSAFSANTAALALARLDWHVLHKWDLMAEGRLLHTFETGTNESGALLGVYRHIGSNTKLGLGYEWGQVSDNMTNLNYTNQGLFLNMVAKF